MNIIKDTNSDNYQPSVALRRYVQALLSDEVSGNKSMAETVSGVKRARFYFHLRNPEFKEWFLKQYQQVFLTNLPKTVYSCQNEANKGNLQAMGKIFKMIGWLDSDKTEQNLNVNLTPNQTSIFTDRIPDLDEQTET